MLDDDDRDVAAAATTALGNYGPAAARLAPNFLKAFHAALIRGDSTRGDALALTLHRVLPNAAHRVKEHFAEIDAELLHIATEYVEDASASAVEETTDSTDE